MNKKVLIAGATAVGLAGLGIYKIVTAQNNDKREADWTTADIPDLSGKVIIVTGANSGIGFEAAKEFARKNAHVILACRSIDKAEAARAAIQAEIPNAQAAIMQLDLASQTSIHEFVGAFQARFNQLDVLVNNAGIMMTPYATTEDGFEGQFGTNHLGHFALTGLLSYLLLNTPGARVVNVSSAAHRMGNMDFDNLMFAEGAGYSPMSAYGRSKLANLLFTYELQRRFAAAGVDSIAVAAHPGLSSTNLSSHLEDSPAYKIAGPLMGRMAQSAAMGALPTIRAAVDPAVNGGDYYGPRGFMQQGGYPIRVDSNAKSHNQDDAQTLWQVSEELTGVHYLD